MIVALQSNLKSEIVLSSGLLLLPRIACFILGLFWFHISFRNDFSSFVINVVGILIGISFNFYISFSSKVILTVLIQ